MSNVLVIALLWFGGFFLLVAAIGLLRLPDVLMRMHAMTKAGTLGISSLALGVALHFGTGDAALRSLLIITFFLITAPIAGHMIGRAAYHRGVIAPGSLDRDEYRDARRRLAELPPPGPEGEGPPVPR